MESKKTIIKILNCFEMGTPDTKYDVIYIFKDSPKKERQITLSTGFTQAGTLWDVFRTYRDLTNGNAISKKLLSYEGKRNDPSLTYDTEFINLMIDTARKDEKFRDAQDSIYDKLYWSKGEKWFSLNGFTLPLSMAVIQDSFLHSGTILDFLRSRFSEKLPAKGGNEKTWIKQYIDVRHEWLKGHSNPILRNTVYRTEFFKKQISNQNWDMTQFPIFPNSVKIVS